MGSENSKLRKQKQKREEDEISKMQMHIKYSSGYKIHKMLQIQNKVKKQEIQDEQQSTFGCFKISPSKQKKKKLKQSKQKSYKLEWVNILMKYCEQLKENYSWAESYIEMIKKLLDTNKLNPFTQKQDQEQLIWVLASLFEIDMYAKYNNNQEEFKQCEDIKEQDDEDNQQYIHYDDCDDEIEDQSFYQCTQNLKKQDNDKFSHYYNQSSQKNKNQQQNNESRIINLNQNDDDEHVNSVLRNTELFIEDVFQRPKINSKSFHINSKNNNTKLKKYDSYDDDELEEEEIFQRKINKKYGQSNLLQTENQLHSMQKEYKKTKIEKSDLSSSQSEKIGTEYTGRSSVSSRKKVEYQNNTIIINQQQQNKYTTKKQQIRMVKMVGFYKKTTEYFENLFMDKKHIFGYFFKEFKLQFLEYYKDKFQEILRSQDTNDELERTIIIDKLNQSQLNKKGNKQNITPEEFRNTNMNSKFTQKSRIQNKLEESIFQDEDFDEDGNPNIELDFKEYYDIAVEEILDFIKIMCQVLVSYFNLSGLKEHRYGKLLEEDNLHNFLVSYIFDEQIHSLLMQYCQKIQFDQELNYAQKLKEFEQITPDMLGIRQELQQISVNYNSLKIKKSQNTDQTELNQQNLSEQQQQNLVYYDIINLFSHLPLIPSPIHKLKLLVRCNELIIKEIEKVQELNENQQDQDNNNKKKKDLNLDSDDIMNAYVYILGKSGVHNLFSQLRLIEGFMNENQKVSHTGYFYITTYSAAQFVLNLTKEQLKGVNNNENKEQTEMNLGSIKETKLDSEQENILPQDILNNEQQQQSEIQFENMSNMKGKDMELGNMSNLQE